MTFAREMATEAREVWSNYCPVLTEAIGVRDVGASLTFLALSSINALIDPQGASRRGMERIAPGPVHCMAIGAKATALSLIKLTVPIIAGVGYLTYKSYY